MQKNKKLILCIDDDADILNSLTIILENEGYGVNYAQSGEDGLRLFKEVNPDFILVDLMMEQVDAGTKLVKNLKLAGNTAPVYMLSSVGDQLSETVNYEDVGLNGVLSKPVQKDALLSIIKAQIG